MTTTPDGTFRASFFVLRTPLLPLRAFLDWGDDGTRSRTDLDVLRTSIRTTMRDPVLAEALWLSSPDLNESAKQRVPDRSENRNLRTDLSLVK